MNAAQIEYRQQLIRRFFTTPPSRQNWTPEEATILKAEGLLGKPRRSRRMSNDEAEIMGRAYTALS
jgi:hypothetical protein